MARRLKYEIEINTDNQMVEAIIDHKLRKLQLSLAKTKGGRLIIDKSSTADVDDDEAEEEPTEWAGAYIRVMDRRVGGFSPVWLAGIAKTKNGDYVVKDAYPLHVYMEHVDDDGNDIVVTAHRYKNTYGELYDLEYDRLNRIITRVIKRDRVALEYSDVGVMRATIRELANSTVHTELLRMNLSFPVLEVSRCITPKSDPVDLEPDVGSRAAEKVKEGLEPYEYRFKNRPTSWGC